MNGPSYDHAQITDEFICRSWTPPRGLYDQVSWLCSRISFYPHSPNFLLSTKCHFSSSLLLSAVLLFTPRLAMFKSVKWFGPWLVQNGVKQTSTTLDDFKYFTFKCYLGGLSKIQHLRTGHAITAASSFLHCLSDHLPCVILLHAGLMSGAYLPTYSLGREGFPDDPSVLKLSYSSRDPTSVTSLTWSF